MEERELIAASQQGQLEAFNQLVLRYQALTYNLACRMLGDREAAADATQEAFLAAYRAICRFQGGSFRSWLLRITTNFCYDYLRLQQRRRTSTFSQLSDEEGEPPPFPDSAPLPEEEVLRRELWGEVQKGLATLPPEQRAAVVLCDVQGLPYDEAAKAMGTSLGTVKSRLSRGRARLRHYLQQRGELLPAHLRHR